MAKIVEQVDVNGNIVNDYDTSLSVKALFEVISNSFPSIYKDDDGMICGEINGKGFAIRAKNITYLGHPHPLYKKRIQIAGDLQQFYRIALEKGRIPILLGVYTYGDNTVFCDFSIEDFIGKKAHNSSAHVYTSDLSAATTDNYYYKEDYFGNRITAFSRKGVQVFLNEKLGIQNDKNDNGSEQYEYRFDEDELKVAEEPFTYDVDLEVGKINRIIMEFFHTTNKKWYGIDCYKTMIEANYRNKYQPEWPGFFLEFEFERYLNSNNYNSIIQFAQDKRKNGIDLDLFFPTLRMYGDLKAHSSNSRGIQGNDWETVFGLIDRPTRNNHIYYVVCEHDTMKDSECNYEVTFFWNKAQEKDNLMSYSKKMKNSVELTHAYIFDINRENKQFLKKFGQGVNSNGKPRKPKIMIEQDNYSDFLLEESAL